MYTGRNSGGGGSDLYLQGRESGCACLVERVEVIHLGNVDEVGLHFSFLSVCVPDVLQVSFHQHF